MKQELIICIGISGSGKSTWSTNYIKDYRNILRINRDDIRRTLAGDLNGYYQRKDLQIIENSVNYTESCLFSEIIGVNNYSCIIDNTNLKQKYINKWISEARFYNISFRFKLFDISLVEARDNVALRDNLTREQTKYIETQYFDYLDIVTYINRTYPHLII